MYTSIMKRVQNISNISIKLEMGKSNLCAFNVLTGGTIRAQEYGYRDGSTTYSASTAGIKSHSSDTLKAFDSTVVVEEA